MGKDFLKKVLPQTPSQKLLKIKKPRKFYEVFCIQFGLEIGTYLLENWDARLAALRPYFFLSFIRGSLVRRPAFLSIGR